MQTTYRQRSGLGTAVLSAAAFGTSGSFATALIGSGWSPAAAVTARLLIAATVLTLPALMLLRGRFAMLVRQASAITGFGVIAIAAAQLCYFNAVARLSVGVALLLKYLGILLVVGWLWLRHGHRPRRLTVTGAVAAIIGLGLVLDVTGSHHLDPIGVLWGLGAAVGLAVYFVVSAKAEDTLPSIPMAWAGMAVGCISLLAAGLAGVVPLRFSSQDVVFLHHHTSWLVPMLGIALIAAVFAYTAGISAARSLGAKFASFVGLSEVLFAVLFAWLLLGQLPGPLQILGGAFIVAGVALVHLDELSADRAPSAGSEPEEIAQSRIGAAAR
ncbi:MAG TPA: EamA family transporter [Jatrophihabitans sp.]|nr:EamA family transporter [Jatrophihabitans sp.]